MNQLVYVTEEFSSGKYKRNLYNHKPSISNLGDKLLTGKQILAEKFTLTSKFCENTSANCHNRNFKFLMASRTCYNCHYKLILKIIKEILEKP